MACPGKFAAGHAGCDTSTCGGSPRQSGRPPQSRRSASSRILAACRNAPSVRIALAHAGLPSTVATDRPILSPISASRNSPPVRRIHASTPSHQLDGGPRPAKSRPREPAVRLRATTSATVDGITDAHPGVVPFADSAFQSVRWRTAGGAAPGVSATGHPSTRRRGSPGGCGGACGPPEWVGGRRSGRAGGDAGPRGNEGGRGVAIRRDSVSGSRCRDRESVTRRQTATADPGGTPTRNRTGVAALRGL